MGKKVWAVAKINLKNIKSPYFTTGLVFGVIFVQSIVYTIIAFAKDTAGEQLQISGGCYFWLLIIMAAIFIPSKNFRRIIHLGGKREDFFWGSLTCHAVLAGAVAVANTVFYHTYERFLVNTSYYADFEAFVQNPAIMDNHYINVNVIDVFGWSGNGVILSILQQFAFLFLLAAVIHTLTAMQDKWYGWVADAAIAAILAVFIPIAPLRGALVWFFGLIIFQPNAFLQITACLILAMLTYSLNKSLFARKAI